MLDIYVLDKGTKGQGNSSFNQARDVTGEQVMGNTEAGIALSWELA